MEIHPLAKAQHFNVIFSKGFLDELFMMVPHCLPTIVLLCILYEGRTQLGLIMVILVLNYGERYYSHDSHIYDVLHF